MDETNNDVVEEQEWILEFHGTRYVVNLLVTDLMLTLEIESSETGERWSGEFTAHYLEEITHKAGNFKKFNVFARMLSTAFDSSEQSSSSGGGGGSVFVDVLTYSDLELLKARKTGGAAGAAGTGASTTSASTFSSKQYQKRYAILTYCGEFDRVHYPLPLAFEESANVPALKRCIARLRRQLREREQIALEPANDKEKELRQIVSQLRQDNTELRHRLRQQHTTGTGSSSASGGVGGAGAAAVNAELASANTKLRRQVEALRRELTGASAAYDKLRTDSAKEIARWKLKIGTGGATGTIGTNGTNGTNGNSVGGGDRDGTPQRQVSELRRRLAATERELRLERLSRGSHAYPYPHSHSGAGAFRGTGAGAGAGVRQRSSGYTAHTATARAGASRLTATSSAARAPAPRGGGGSSRGLQPRAYGGRPSAARSESPVLTRRSSHSPQQTHRGGHGHGPTAQYGRGHAPDSSAARRSQSVSPSSSLGGRFDPTAYQQQRQEQLRRRQGDRAWNAGSSSWGRSRSSSPQQSPQHQHQRSYRYRSPGPGESGYTSGNSQSSGGSSRRSQRSSATEGSRSTRSSRRSTGGGGSSSDVSLGRRQTCPKKKRKEKAPPREAEVERSSARREALRKGSRGTPAPAAAPDHAYASADSARFTATGAAHSESRRRKKYDYAQRRPALREDSETDEGDAPAPVPASRAERQYTPGTKAARRTHAPAATAAATTGAANATATNATGRSGERSDGAAAGAGIAAAQGVGGRTGGNDGAAERNKENDRGATNSMPWGSKDEGSETGRTGEAVHEAGGSGSGSGRREISRSEASHSSRRGTVDNVERGSHAGIASGSVRSSRDSSWDGGAERADNVHIAEQISAALKKEPIGPDVPTSRGGDVVEGLLPRRAAATAAANPLRSSSSSQQRKKQQQQGGAVSVSSSTSSLGGAGGVEAGRNLLSNPDEDISEIDKRIQALQSYLDNARVGILAADKHGAESGEREGKSAAQMQSGSRR